MAQGVLSKDTELQYEVPGVEENPATWTNIPYLMEVPEMGGDAEQVEVTTLADSMRKHIPGIKDMGDLTFQFLYDNSASTSNYRVLKGFETANSVKKFRVEYPDGSTHTFEAMVTVKMDSAAVNAALTFTATFYLQSDITSANPS